MPPPWPWPPGTIVVCLDASRLLNAVAPCSRPLVEGEYYTIREAGTRLHTGQYVRGVLLNEITRPVHRGTGVEYGFLASRFRPAESTHSESTTVAAQQKVSQ